MCYSVRASEFEFLHLALFLKLFADNWYDIYLWCKFENNSSIILEQYTHEGTKKNLEETVKNLKGTKEILEYPKDSESRSLECGMKDIRSPY